MKHLILLHGAIGSSQTFTELIKLLPAELNIHTIDFPGHGSDEKSTEEYSIKYFGDRVISLMDKKQIESAFIFGYSLGGYVALNLANLYPSRVSAVFTFATIFNWTPDNASKQSGFLNTEKIKTKVPAFADQLMKLHGENKWEIVLSRTADMLIRLGNDPDLKKEVLEGITQPVLISVGDRDQMVSIDESISTFKILPNSSLAILPNTSHPFEKLNLSLLASHIKSFFSI